MGPSEKEEGKTDTRSQEAGTLLPGGRWLCLPPVPFCQGKAAADGDNEQLWASAAAPGTGLTSANTRVISMLLSSPAYPAEGLPNAHRGTRARVALRSPSLRGVLVCFWNTETNSGVDI